MKYVSREILKEKFNKKVSYIMRSVASTRGRKLDPFPELHMCDLWRQHSHLENISALQFFVANYHSTQAPYMYVIRF